jgi:hypothetical protein
MILLGENEVALGRVVKVAGLQRLGRCGHRVNQSYARSLGGKAYIVVASVS